MPAPEASSVTTLLHERQRRRLPRHVAHPSSFVPQASSVPSPSRSVCATASTSRAAAIFGSPEIYASRCVRRFEAIAGTLASSAMRALGARSFAPRSSVPAGPRSALERVYASPPFPTGTSSVAPPSAPLLSSLSACETRPSAPHPPLSASQRALSAQDISRARPRACDRLTAAARFVCRVAARPRVRRRDQRERMRRSAC